MFSYYFITRLLQEAGWPRKQGMFRGEAYDTDMVDLAVGQSHEWAAALGAGRPRFALQMIAEMFSDRDWEGDDAPDIKGFVTGADWSDVTAPQEASPRAQFAEHGKSMRPEQLQEARMRALLDQQLLFGLLWGLANPDRFEAWYGSKLADYGEMLPTYREAGLDVDQPPTLPGFYEASETIIRDYEADIGPLPAIPARLLDDARALGRDIPK